MSKKALPGKVRRPGEKKPGTLWWDSQPQGIAQLSDEELRLKIIAARRNYEELSKEDKIALQTLIDHYVTRPKDSLTVFLAGELDPATRRAILCETLAGTTDMLEGYERINNGLRVNSDAKAGGARFRINARQLERLKLYFGKTKRAVEAFISMEKVILFTEVNNG